MSLYNMFHGTMVEDKNCINLNIFLRDIKENASGCFCLMFRQKKHVFFISRWKMFRFIQNFQGTFVGN